EYPYIPVYDQGCQWGRKTLHQKGLQHLLSPPLTMQTITSMKKSAISTVLTKPAPNPGHFRATRPAPSNGDAESSMDAEAVLSALVAFKKGNFSVRLPLTWTGVSGKVADAFNEVAELMAHQTEELSRISRVVGKEGRIQERLSVGHVNGAWAERVDSVNKLI